MKRLTKTIGTLALRAIGVIALIFGARLVGAASNHWWLGAVVPLVGASAPALRLVSFIASVVVAGVFPHTPALLHTVLHLLGPASALAGYLVWQRSDPAYDFRRVPDEEG